MSGHRNSRVTSSSSSNDASNEGTSSTNKRSKVEFKVNSSVRVGAAASAFQSSSSTKTTKQPAGSSHSENIWTVVDANDVSGEEEEGPVFSVTDSTMPGDVGRHSTRKASNDGGKNSDTKGKHSKEKETRRSSKERSTAKQTAKQAESSKDLNSSTSRPSSSVGGRASQQDQHKSTASPPRNESGSGRAKKSIEKTETKKHSKKGASRSRSRSPRESKKSRKTSPEPVSTSKQASSSVSLRKRSRDRERSRSPVAEIGKKVKSEKFYSSKQRSRSRSRSRDASTTPVERRGRSRSKEPKRRSISKERRKVDIVPSSSSSTMVAETGKLKRDEGRNSISTESTTVPTSRGRKPETRERESREDIRGGRDRGRGVRERSRSREAGGRRTSGRYLSESGSTFAGPRGGYPTRKADESPSSQRRIHQSESSQVEVEGSSKRRSKRDSVSEKKSEKKKEKGNVSPSTAVRRLKDASDDELEAKLAKMEKRGALLVSTSTEPSTSHDSGYDWTSFAQELAGLQSHHKIPATSNDHSAGAGVDVISSIGVASTLLSKTNVEKLFEVIRDASGLQQLNPVAAFHSIEFAKRKQQMEAGGACRSRSSRSSGSLPPLFSTTTTTTSSTTAAPTTDSSATSTQRKQTADALRAIIATWSSPSVVSAS